MSLFRSRTVGPLVLAFTIPIFAASCGDDGPDPSGTGAASSGAGGEGGSTTSSGGMDGDGGNGGNGGDGGNGGAGGDGGDGGNGGDGGGGGADSATLTVHFRALDGGTSSIASSPPGAACTGPVCDAMATLPLGTSVTLTVTQPLDGLVSWSNGCTGSTCDVVLDEDTAVEVNATVANIAFVTSQGHDGNFGGVDGADAFCQSVAEGANLPGTFRAFLNTSTERAFDRLTSARGWIRPDGRPITDTLQAFRTAFGDESTNVMWYPVSVDETGADVHRQPLIGDYFGPASAYTCADWTTSTGFTRTPQSSKNAGVYWLGGYGADCNEPRALTCFGMDLTHPVAVTPLPGRKVFVSNARLAMTATGIATADALCRQEASEAGLSNAATYLAALSTTTAAASARFDLNGAPWVRVDGVRVAATPADFMNGVLEAPVYLRADGSPANDGQSPVVWTGGSLSSPGPVTCSDWTGAGSGGTGVAAAASPQVWTWNATTCDVPRGVLCLEP